MANNDAKKFELLVEPHLDALFRLAYRLTGNTADAEDLVQDTSLRAYQEVSTLDEAKPVKAWLRTVMHNRFLDGARRVQRSPVVTTTDDYELTTRACPDPNPEEQASMTQREELLHRAWLKLDRRQCALLALRAEGYSLGEIAAITDVPIDALQSRLYRARLNFARNLKEQRQAQPEISKEMSK